MQKLFVGGYRGGHHLVPPEILIVPLSVHEYHTFQFNSSHSLNFRINFHDKMHLFTWLKLISRFDCHSAVF